MCSEQILAKHLNIFLVYKHLLWVRLTVPTRKVIACAVEKLLTQLFSTVLKVLSSLYSITLLAINPKIGARLVGTHFSQLTMLGLVISSNELCFLTANSQERHPDSQRMFKRDEVLYKKTNFKNKMMMRRYLSIKPAMSTRFV